MVIGVEIGGFQDICHALRRSGEETTVTRAKHREFIEASLTAADDDGIHSIIRASNGAKRDRNDSGTWVIGDPDFQKSVIEKDRQNSLTLARCRRENISLDDVSKKTGRKTGVEAHRYRQKSKRTSQADARMIFCFLARELGFPTLETGNFLGIQQAAVSNAAKT